MSQVIVTITPAGTVKIDAVGFKGGACEKATEQLHVVLGGGTFKEFTAIGDQNFFTKSQTKQ